MKCYDNLLEQQRCCWLSFRTCSSDVQNRARPSASSETQGLWVDFKSGWKSLWGHCLTRLVPNGCSHNQSEVCFRVLSSVLTWECTRSLVARLVCLGRATKLCSRWKVSVSAHNVREIDQIVRENLTRNYTEYFRRYHKRTYLKVCEVRIKHYGCRRRYVALNFRRDVSLRARGHWANFCLFCEKICHQFPKTSAPGYFLDLPNFVKAYQTSKTPSSCLGAGQIFVRREIWQICQFTCHDLKEHVNQENFISTFSQSISIRSPPKLFLRCAAIKRWRWQIRASVCCITILTQNTTITVPKFTFQLHLQGQVMFNLYQLK